MSSGNRFLAFDLGAESGRGVIGTIDHGKMELADVHRFPNGPVAVGDRLYWNTLRLFSEIKETIGIASRDVDTLSGLGVSTWGIDFAMFDKEGELACPPHCYRDPQTTGMMEKVFEIVPKEEVFEETGIQFMSINALFHLYAYAMRTPERLERVKRILNTPDSLNYWLTGIYRSELTIASTTQFFRGKDNTFATAMLERLGLPTDVFAETIEPGTLLGPLAAGTAEEIGVGPVPVIAVAGHDTACAMAAVPYIDPGAAAISCGTWSSIGVEVPEQCRTSAALANNFTNEIGVGSFMFRKNMMGLWSLQECRRVWSHEGNDYSYAELAQMAGREPGGSIIEPDYVEFLMPGDMPKRIAEFCRTTKQSVPEGAAAVARAIFDGMALKYRFLVDQIDEMLDRKTEVVHLVGGGSRNELLCQLTANALGRRVIAGPAEAAAMGNVMLQAIATGLISDAAAGREIIRNSVSPQEYTPAESGKWNDLFGRFVSMRSGVETAF